MSIVTKQLIMNEIRLPTDMINIIKEYSFYNIEEVAKKNKEKVCRAIVSVEFSRANRFNGDPNYSDNDENWVFGYDYETNEYGEEIQLQATNCSVCGNYIHYCHDFNIKSINEINEKNMTPLSVSKYKLDHRRNHTDRENITLEAIFQVLVRKEEEKRHIM